MTSKSAMSDDERKVFERMKDWVEDRNLEDGLRAEYERHSTQRGEAELTVAERRWYQRPVHQAMTQLREPIDATPENWGSGLYSAYSAFSSELDRMNEVYDIPKEWMQWKEPMH